MDQLNFGNRKYKQPRKQIKKADRKPTTEREKRLRYEQRHPKYPCRFCPGKFMTDNHTKIKGKNGAQGYCNSCAKLHKEIIAREEAGEHPLALMS